MQVTLSVQIEADYGPAVHNFGLDSTDLVFLPQVGDEIQLPGMDSSVKVASREFIYKEPNILQIWFHQEE